MKVRCRAVDENRIPSEAFLCRHDGDLDDAAGRCERREISRDQSA